MRYCLLLIAVVLYAQAPSVENAWKLIGRGQRTEAVALLRDVIKAQPTNADARLLLGSVLMEAGEQAESIVQLREGVRLRPKSAEAHNALGEAFNTFGDPKSAQPEFENAVALNPAFAQAHSNLASVLAPQGENDAAKKHLDRAILLFGKKPEAAEPLYLRAKIYTAERDAAKAAGDLSQAVALRPDYAEAWSDLGEAKKALMDDDGALQAFIRAVELSPEDAIAQTRLGQKLLEAGKPQDAIAPLQQAARLDPSNTSTLNALQLALRKNGQKDDADAVKRRLAETIRNKDQADQKLVAAVEINNKGSELEKSGDVRGALERYRAALAMYPEHVGIRTNLAVALLKLGKWDEGIREMREALRRDPSNVDLKKALDDALAQAKANKIVLSADH
jgi:protein O-GlcNAc transferase